MLTQGLAPDSLFGHTGDKHLEIDLQAVRARVRYILCLSAGSGSGLAVTEGGYARQQSQRRARAG